MAITVTVRVSRTLEEPDLDELRNWLERTYPGAWEVTAGPEAEGTLGSAEVLIDAVLTASATGFGQGFGQALGDATVEEARKAAERVAGEIKERFRRIREKYPEGEEPEIEVDVETHHDGETPSR